jgi:hypothetical protein
MTISLDPGTGLTAATSAPGLRSGLIAERRVAPAIVATLIGAACPRLHGALCSRLRLPQARGQGKQEPSAWRGAPQRAPAVGGGVQEDAEPELPVAAPLPAAEANGIDIRL